MLTLIWIVIGWQLHKRLSYIEMINKVQQHDSWHKNKQ